MNEWINILLAAIVGAVLGIIFEIIILWKYGPNIHYGIVYRLNKREKSKRNVLVPIMYIRTSDHFDTDISREDLIKVINETLIEESIPYKNDQTGFEIMNYRYGTSEYSGKILFSYKDFEEGLLDVISYEFSKNCSYNELSTDIFGLVNAIKELEEIISIKLSEKVNHHDIISSKLDKIKEVTLFMQKFKDVEGMGYLLIPGNMKIQLNTDEILLSDEIDDKGLAYLKEMITMYS